MTSDVKSEFNPTVWFPPGETLLEILETLGMTQAELADRTGKSTKHISQIINGKASISVEMALQLERVLDVPSHIWQNLEQNYRAYLARKEEDERIRNRKEEYKDWIRLFPYREMVKLNWIRDVGTVVDKSKELLQYFRIASLDEWDSGEIVGYGCRLRSSGLHDAGIGALLAWLWKGRLAAMETVCEGYDQHNFEIILKDIRQVVPDFTVTTPKRLQTMCASAGVALVFVHELPRMGAYGATSWVSPDKALLQMCLRGKREDQFWFTFFHEAGHILLHGKTDCFVEVSGTGDEDTKEFEANTFAANYLISPSIWNQFKSESIWRTLNQLTHGSGKARIIAFARQQKVTPGIVVGRLQREEIVEHSFYNDLKVSLAWSR